MNVALPYEIIDIIESYMQPTLMLRCTNKKYLKLINPKIELLYWRAFYYIHYLRAMRIRPTYEAMCIYFPEYTAAKKMKQCNAYTKKGLRCMRYSCDTFCYQHKNTLHMYRNSKMYRFLMQDIPPSF